MAPEGTPAPTPEGLSSLSLHLSPLPVSLDAMRPPHTQMLHCVMYHVLSHNVPLTVAAAPPPLPEEGSPSERADGDDDDDSRVIEEDGSLLRPIPQHKVVSSKWETPMDALHDFIMVRYCVHTITIHRLHMSALTRFQHCQLWDEGGGQRRHVLCPQGQLIWLIGHTPVFV